MAASLHFHGVVRTTHSFRAPRNLHSSRMASLSLLASRGRLPCAAIENSSPNRTPRVGAKKKNRIEGAMREDEDEDEEEAIGSEKAGRFTCVMKFGGSSLASAERIREMADLILRFPEENPVVVLSAMGKTTNNLLLAGEKAVSCGVSNASEIDELSLIKELHLRSTSEGERCVEALHQAFFECGHVFKLIACLTYYIILYCIIYKKYNIIRCVKL